MKQLFGASSSAVLTLGSVRRLVGLACLAGLLSCGGGGGGGTASSTVSPATASPEVGQLSLVLGGLGGPGNVDGVGNQARFNSPSGMVVDAQGNLYVADTGNALIRKVTPSGEVSTFAGGPGDRVQKDGQGAAARFEELGPMALDASGNLFVLDAGVIRKINSAGWVSTPGGKARWTSMAVDRLGRLYGVNEFPIGSVPGYRSGVVSTVQRIADPAATSEPETVTPASVATSSELLALTSDGNNNVFLIGTKTISAAGSAYRKKSLEFFQLNDSGVFMPLSLPQSTGELAACNCNWGDRLSLAVDAGGHFHVGFKIYAYAGTESELVVAQFSRSGTPPKIYRSTDIGSKDGTFSQALFEDMQGLATDAAGNLYVADTGNHSVRRISPAGLVTTIAGSPLDKKFQESATANLTGSQAAYVNRRAVSFYDVAVSPDGRDVYVNFERPLVFPSFYMNPTVALVHRVGSQGQAETIQVGKTFGSARFYFDAAVSGDIFALGQKYSASNRSIDFTTFAFSDFGSTVLGRYGAVYFSYEQLTIVVVGLSGAASKTPLLDGTGTAAEFENLQGFAVDATDQLYVVDRDNYPSFGAVIRRVSPDGVVTSLAGQRGVAGANDGPGPQASFRNSSDAVVDKMGNLYVADTGNHTIRKITPEGVVSTVVGQTGKAGVSLGALPGRLTSPTGVAIDDNNMLYIATPGAVLRVRMPE